MFKCFSQKLPLEGNFCYVGILPEGKDLIGMSIVVSLGVCLEVVHKGQGVGRGGQVDVLTVLGCMW